MENLDVFLLALFCFIMGATLVGAIVYLRSGQKRRPADENSPDPDLVEVAHLWRSRNTNRMIVELDEKNYASASELSVNQQQRLASTASVLQTWLREGAPSPAPTPEIRTNPSPEASPLANDQPTPASLAQEVKPIAARPLEAFSRVFTTTSTQTAPKFKSIATQINEILQAHLPGSPFEAQGIALVETPNQGVVVRVGSEEYQGVDAVPNPEVRAFIKAAVAEWEGKAREGIR
jgi:hypothetical protein